MEDIILQQIQRNREKGSPSEKQESKENPFGLSDEDLAGIDDKSDTPWNHY